MIFSLFKKTYDSLAQNNKLYFWIIVVLSVVILGQQWSLMTERTRVVLKPPYLDTAARIGYATASKNYYESWGLFVAELVGNLTPGDAHYVADNLGKLFDASDYAIVKAKVLASAAAEREDQANFAFHVKQTIWQPANKTVFVYGNLSQINSDGETISKIPYTFSMGVHIEAGRPVLDGFDAYQGEPHTIKWLISQGKTKGKN